MLRSLLVNDVPGTSVCEEDQCWAPCYKAAFRRSHWLLTWSRCRIRDAILVRCLLRIATFLTLDEVVATGDRCVP